MSFRQLLGAKLCSLIIIALLWIPSTALAGATTLGISLGQEFQFKPPPQGQARGTSLMISPGMILGEIFRAELGINYMVDTYRRGKSDLEIRPCLAVQPRGIDWYARIHMGLPHLLDGEKGESRPSIGGAVGRTISFGGVQFFAEVGANPRTELTMTERRDPDGEKKFRLFWILEGRAGITYVFPSEEE
jgi:hypothetical protein|tara:strand:+ start:96 stop:662 length:567 start_codon:yes stop_codon:yes gene_type:complete